MRYALLALIMVCCHLSSAQLNGKYIFKNIGVKDGLLHSSVMDIRQDSRGFIWIVTPNGLQRFDGYRFVNYPQVVNYPLDIGPYFKLIIDSTNNKVGMAVVSIMQCLDLATNRISTVSMEKLTAESQPKPFIFKSNTGITYAISDKGSNIFENDSLTGTYIFSDREQNIWLIRDSTSGEMFIPLSLDVGVVRNGSSTVEFMTDANPTHPLLIQLLELEEYFSQLNIDYLKKIFIQHAVMDSYRNLWIVPWNEYLLRYDLNTQQLHFYDLQRIKERQIREKSGDPVMRITQVYEDRQRNLWIAIDNGGIVRYHRQDDDFQFITSDSRVKDGLEYSFQVFCIYQDRDDNLWIGTDKGINIFNPYRNQVQIVRHQDGNPNSLPKIDVNSIIETREGEILVGSWGGGVTVFDRQWNFLRKIEFDGGVLQNQVWCLLQHPDGNIWIGAQAGYIHIYDPVLRTVKTIRPPETGYNTIMYMQEDMDGNIVMGHGGDKITLWNKKEEKFYTYNYAADSSYASTNFNNLFVDNQNQVWSSVSYGLKKYDQNRRVYTGIYPMPQEGRRGRNTLGIESYNDSLLLVGSVHGGLQLFNKNTFEYMPFLAEQLPEYSTVNAVKKDNSGNIWFTTESDLYKINPEMDVTRIDLGDKVVINALGSAWFYELSDGRWVTSSWAELICFHPGDFESNSADLDIQVSGFKLFDQDIYVDSFIAQQKPVILNHRQNFFSIEFANLHYHDIRSVTYYYRLSDVDRDWVRTETPLAEYTDIKPGEYVFEVKAEQGNNLSGVTSLSIIITPPWWSTWWFRVVCLVVAISLVSFGVRKRIQIIRKQSELKHRIAESEMMALRAQMNPHFIFNCINSIDAMIQGNDKYRATTYLNKFARLIRNILDTSASNKVPLSKDMETLRLYVELEHFRHENKFTSEFRIEDELLQSDYKVPPLIIQPYVENAILHGLRNKQGNTGRLFISVSKRDDYLLFRIEDNGVGRRITNGNSANNTTGFGLQMSSDRIRLFNNEDIASVKITDLVENGKPCGTRVDVELKVS